MNLLLNINTALETASLSLAQDGIILQQATNTEQRDHGSFLQTAIQLMLKKEGRNINELDAIAVVEGPGSYTGLRVGMASAKGLCYALKKPLITVSTLKLITYEAMHRINIKDISKPTLFCPMIDARRMEVFTALYDKNFNFILKACAMILTPESFAKELLNYDIYFFGNGALKWEGICANMPGKFIAIQNNTLCLSKLTNGLFIAKDFADLAYSEPMYVKDFHTG